MKINSFRLSAVAISVVMGVSGSAFATTAISSAVKDVSALSENSEGYYTGGGAVHIGGQDIAVNKDGGHSSFWWENINQNTPGFDALQKSAGYKPGLASDLNYPLNEEDYQNVVHGERLVSFANGDKGYDTPIGVVSGLKMGTADNRYQKVQDVTLYRRDASGNILYQMNADGTPLLDSKGNKIPLTVTHNNLVLDQNSDVYIQRQENAGGQFGLQESAIYSKVKSFSDDVAAVTVTGDLRETAVDGRGRDVFIIQNTTVDNTLDTDIAQTGPSNNNEGDEHKYNSRPHAVGVSITSSGVDYDRDAKGNIITDSEHLTNVVPQTANVILDNAQITAKNLAADHRDNHDYINGHSYDYNDSKSTAVTISGSGLFVSVANNSTLTGGVKHEGNALNIAGHANRVDVNHSTLNGNVNITHDSHSPYIDVHVIRDDKTNSYTAVGANAGVVGYAPVDREHNGTTLNITNQSVVNGDITARGRTQFQVRIFDVTGDQAPVELSKDQIINSQTAHDIYNNAVSSVGNTIIANNNGDYTPVRVNVDNSTVNGRVSGITNIDYPVNSTVTGQVASWNPDLLLTNGSVWNAAATAEYGDPEAAVSNVHDLNLSNSHINLVNVNTDTPTLGGRGRYEDVATARIVVHGDMTQNKDADGRYQGSQITVGKSVVEPLLNVGGNYVLGSMQIKGTVHGNYLLTMANSGVEPYLKQGYVAQAGTYDEASDKAHSFVNYKGTGSDAHFVGRTELGVYQYDVVDEANDTLHDEHNVYFKSTGRLSNSAATAMSMDASMVNVATMESDNLRDHLAQSRHANDEGGVWVSYFGGKNRATTSGGAGYSLQTNGVMLGVDNVFDAKKGGNWLAGIAFSSARSDLDVRNSRGDLDSYGAQFYLSRRWDNGVFVDTAAQFNHFSNSARVHMLDGQSAHKDYSSNGYGLGMKVGYTWEDMGFFAEPYVGATGRVFDGAHYTLNNGMVVDGDDYKSMVGEIGANVGYTFDLSNDSYVKPYFHLAGLNEFADSNKMKINNKNLDNSIDGAAVQVGLGTEVKIMKDFGGYASFNYTGGDNTERPWEARVGVNYTW